MSAGCYHAPDFARADARQTWYFNKFYPVFREQFFHSLVVRARHRRIRLFSGKTYADAQCRRYTRAKQFYVQIRFYQIRAGFVPDEISRESRAGN